MYIHYHQSNVQSNVTTDASSRNILYISVSQQSVFHAVFQNSTAAVLCGYVYGKNSYPQNYSI
jgi:hypothetical protein